MDEASPQTTANTVRVWSPEKPHSVKNTKRIKANAVGFYAVNGTSAIEFPTGSKTKDICGFLDAVRASNGGRPVVIVLDNFAVHRSAATAAYAGSIGIRLVFLPPYSPHLNPIEFVWKTLKRSVSKIRFTDREDMTSLLGERFIKETAKTSYFAYWRALFL